MLSDHTWGVGVSLQDFQPLAFGAAPAKGSKITKKPTTTTSTTATSSSAGGGGGGGGAGAKGEDFSGGVRHPLHCYTFLKALKSRLDVSDNAFSSAGGSGKGAKGGKSPVKAKKGGSDAVVIVGPRSGGLKVPHAFSHLIAHPSTRPITHNPITLPIAHHITHPIIPYHTP